MMKKILAAAIVSAFAAPAFAATANVDIYGAVRASVDYVDADGAANEGRTRVSSNNSRIGFKGAEDLGGGLSAIWQWEYAFQLDQQGAAQPQTSSATQGAVSYRNTFVGLSSKTLGALTLGAQETPLKTSTGPLAVFGDTLGDYRSVFTKSSVRADNSVMYTSPNLSGFVFRVLGGAQNEAGNGTNNDPSFYSTSGVYKNGPLYATLAYQKGKTVSGANVASDSKVWRAGVGYTFGNTKLGLAYENDDLETNGVTSNDGSAWYLSAAHKIGNVTLAAGYTDRDESLSGADDGAKQFTVGAEYSLSKRTGLYALYTKVSNDSLGSTGIGASTGIATVGTVAGGDATGFSLGMNHSF